MNEKVSIIIPVYNVENTIVRCIESIVNGTYQNIEIILVDDCSKDSSVQICRDLEKKYSTIKLLQNKQNQGVSYTRNRALEIVSGQYCMFVDSDDWVDNDYVESFVREMKKTGVGMVISGYVNHDEIISGRVDKFGWKESMECQITDRIEDLYHNRMLQQLWNKIFLVSIIKEYNIQFDESISMGEDYRFILRYLQKMENKKCILLDKYLYHYIRGEGNSLMSKFSEKDVSQQIYNIKLMLPLMKIQKQQQEIFFEKEKAAIEEQYAYMLMHRKMSVAQKIKKMKAGTKKGWIRLYVRMSFLLLKEKFAKIMK